MYFVHDGCFVRNYRIDLLSYVHIGTYLPLYLIMEMYIFLKKHYVFIPFAILEECSQSNVV